MKGGRCISGIPVAFFLAANYVLKRLVYRLLKALILVFFGEIIKFIVESGNTIKW